MNQYTQVVNSDVFSLESILYFPMGEHVPVYNRPFMVNASNQALEVVRDRLDESKLGRVTGSIIGSVMGNLIQPSAGVENTIIDQGWVTNPRFVFLLKVKAVDAMGAEIISYIQGFTDYDGINRGTGTMDMNMVHHINSIVETTCMTLNTPLGVIRKEKLYKVYNVFSSHSQEFYTQRPMDVIENVSLMGATNFMNDGGTDITSTNLGNYISPFNSSVISSNIDNNIGAEYLCKVINAGMQKQLSQSIFLNSYEINEDTTAANITCEPSINDNRFIKYISRQAGFMTVKENFTFSQLMSVDASFYDRFDLIIPTKTYMNPMLLNTPTTGDHWYGQDPVTVKAYSLIESSVALAMKYGFNKLFFTVSNMTDPTMLVNAIITDFKSFISLDDTDFSFLLEMFKSKFITDVFIGETMGGSVPMHAEVYVDLLGTSKIYLNYGGFDPNWYTIPTTANSLFSPVLTANAATLEAVTIQFDQMIGSLTNRNNVTRDFY